jgi:hypothetical protein
VRSGPRGEGRRGFLNLNTEDFAAYFQHFEHAPASRRKAGRVDTASQSKAQRRNWAFIEHAAVLIRRAITLLIS